MADIEVTESQTASLRSASSDREAVSTDDVTVVTGEVVTVDAHAVANGEGTPSG